MDKFVILLLEKESTAILPNFGAIVIANEITGDLMFNEYLKFNDGKLDNIIVSNSNMELQEAQNYIAKHIREIQAEIDKGNEYSIFGLGSFLKDKDGSVVFKGSLKNDQVQKPTEESTVIAGPSPTPPKKEVEKEIDNPKKTTEKEEETISTEKTVDEKQTSIKKEKVEKPITVAQSSKEKKSTKKENKYTDKSKTEKPKAKRKKSPLFFILIFVLVIIAGGSTYIGLNYDDFKAMMGWDKFEEVKDPKERLAELDQNEENEEDLATEETKESDNVISEGNTTDELKENDSLSTAIENPNEEVIEESIQDASEPEVEEKDPVQGESIKEDVSSSSDRTIINSAEGNYHIIAGTFTEQTNAEGLVSELQQQGYPAEIIGFLNNMHYVSVQSFASQSDAYSALSKINNDVPRAWIYKKP